MSLLLRWVLRAVLCLVLMVRMPLRRRCTGIDIAVVVPAVGPGAASGRRHGSEGGGGVGEVGEGLVVGVEGAAGVGEAEVARVYLLVVGVHGGDAVVVVVVVVVVLFAARADLGREGG